MDNQPEQTDPSQPAPPPDPTEPAITPQPVVSTPRRRFPVKGLLLTLLAIILIVVAAGGTYVWQHKKVNSLNAKVTSLQNQVTNLNQQLQKAKKSSTTSSQSSNQYAGWKSYTLKYEQANFKYPDTWKLSDRSSDNSDDVNLTGPNNFTMSIETGGLGHPSFDGPAPVLAADSIRFTGKQGYMDYTSTGNDGLVEEISLSQSATNFLDTFKSKASGDNEASGGNFAIQAQYQNPTDPNSNPPTRTLAQAKADQNYQDAILVVESMSY